MLIFVIADQQQFRSTHTKYSNVQCRNQHQGRIWSHWRTEWITDLRSIGTTEFGVRGRGSQLPSNESTQSSVVEQQSVPPLRLYTPEAIEYREEHHICRSMRTNSPLYCTLSRSLLSKSVCFGALEQLFNSNTLLYIKLFMCTVYI